MVCSERAAQEFLTHRRFAVVGASADPKAFGNTVYKALRDAKYDVVPVNPSAQVIEDDPAYPDLASAPGPFDGVVVMVNKDAAVDVVRQCAAQGVPRVWLFKGLGAPGSVSDEAIALCRDNKIEVVAGACPLMFIEPVGWFHKAHRSMRHVNGSLSKAA